MKLLHRFRSVRGRLALIAITSIITAQLEAIVLVLLVPLASTLADDTGRYENSFGPFEVSLSVSALTALIVVGIVVALLLTTWQAWLRAGAVARWQNEARRALVADWLAADWPTQAAARVGALPTLVGFTQRGATMLTGIAGIIRNGFTLLVFVVTAIAVSAQAAIVLAVTGVVLIALLQPLVKRAKRGNQRLARLTRRFNDELTEVGGLGRDIKVFDAADPIERRFGDLGRRIERARARQSLWSSMTQPLYQYVGLLFGVVAVYLVASRGSTTVESLGAVALLLIRSLSYGQATQSAYQTLVEVYPFLEMADRYRDELTAATEPDGTVVLETVHTLRLEAVEYRYQDAGPPALEGVDVAFRAGEIVGLVGRSGSGKSTLAQLLLRLRRPTAGQVTVNGEPAEEVTLRSWRHHVVLVPQDVPLFRGTVHENIAFFDDAIDRDDVRWAARAVGLDATIDELEHGYDTEIGPGTRSLSGGQIQRIGIARAMARRPSVLVLDEPTSALDVHSEAVIQESIERLRGQILVIIIAHRLSTLGLCDRLVVLDHGRVESDGPLVEVFGASPYFREALENGLIAGDASPGAGGLS